MYTVLEPHDLRDRRVVILGLARQGIALARFLVQAGARVTVSDMQPAAALGAAPAALADLPVQLALGGHPLTLLDGTDLLCLSGGVPPDLPIVQAARARGIALSNDALLTLQHCPALTVGITGSSGKTTTTTLVGEMLQASGLPTWVGGNIGTPLIDRLGEIGAHDRVVLELSSFQLELFDPALCLGAPVGPDIAGVLNVTPNHLDRHPSMAAYAAAKHRLLEYQPRGGTAVFGLDNDVTRGWWEACAAAGRVQTLGFSLHEAPPAGAYLHDDTLLLRHVTGDEEAICRSNEVRLRGGHNVANLLAACCLSRAAGASVAAMRQVATTFAGVAHRLELVRQFGGVSWYNDSIATTPERALAAIHSFDEPIVLLAGGRDKHLPWGPLAAAVRDHVRCVVTFGEAADLIERELADWASSHPGAPGRAPAVHGGSDLAGAVSLAATLARPGDVVLLSPGGTSYDAYQDFAARGEHYRALVKAL